MDSTAISFSSVNSSARRCIDEDNNIVKVINGEKWNINKYVKRRIICQKNTFNLEEKMTKSYF